MKRIRFSRHAYERLQDRGATVEEVVEAIRTADWTPVASGRWSCQKDYRFESVWNGKFYAMKQVRPIFVEEPEEICCGHGLRVLFLTDCLRDADNLRQRS